MPVHKLETRIDISASAEKVWALLTVFPFYGQWNPFIRSIEGSLEVGQKLKVSIQSPGQPPRAKHMTFEPTVLTVDPNRELCWKGKLLPGLFDCEHYFVIEAKPGGVTFHQGELFTGLLVPLLRRTLDGQTRQGFIAMNEALKLKAEQS